MFLSTCHLFDGSQGVNASIMRSVGAQFYISLFSFLGFYVVGAPIGLSLLLKTELKGIGFLIGFNVGAFVLVFSEYIYIYLIDWRKEAQKAFDLSKEYGRQAYSSIDDSNSEENLPDENTALLANANSIITGVDSGETRRNQQSFKFVLCKRFAVLVVLAAIFTGLLMLRFFIQIPDPNSNNNTTNITTTTPWTTTTTTTTTKLL